MSCSSKNVLIIGAGIHGITIALELAKKHKVTIIDSHNDILLGTSNSTPLPANTIDTGVNTITITSIATGTQVTIVNDLTGARSIVTVPIY